MIKFIIKEGVLMIRLNFFDNGEVGELKYFGLGHLIPIIIMGIIIFLIIKYHEQIRNWRHEPGLRMAMAFVMIIAEMSYFWLKLNPKGSLVLPNVTDHLPITVCGWACVFGSFLLLSKNKTLFDINYFWVFAGSINALITPAVITSNGPTHFRYYQFWIEHTMLFISMIYMIYVHQMRPTWRSMVKSFVALLVLALIAIYVNHLLPGANYLFLASVEEGDSILNVLPTNLGFRLLIMGSIIMVMYFIVYLPWFIKDYKYKKMRLA